MGRKKRKGRNSDGSVSQTCSRGDPREAKLRDLFAKVEWDGDFREPWELKAKDLDKDQPGFLVTVDNFLTPYECKQIRRILDDVGLNEPSKADLTPRKNEAFLARLSLACPCTTLYEKLWSRLAPLAPRIEDNAGRCRTALGLTERLRYYIYNAGHRFDAHVDVSMPGAGNLEYTDYTLLIYLNGNVEGGETIFWETKKIEKERVKPEEGKLLLHAHGARCLMHAGDLVRKGSKYMLRADVMYAPEGQTDGGQTTLDRFKPQKKDFTV